jgi:excisionase family DNA binding protein
MSTPQQIQPITLAPTKAAAFLGIGKTKMMALIRAGRIPVKRLDGRLRVSVAALKAFHDALPDGYEPARAVGAHGPERRCNH